MKKLFLITVMAAAAITTSAQETMTPLTVTKGWQADIFCKVSPSITI